MEKKIEIYCLSVIDLSDDESHDFEVETEIRKVFLKLIKENYAAIKLASAPHGVKPSG